MSLWEGDLKSSDVNGQNNKYLDKLLAIVLATPGEKIKEKGQTSFYLQSPCHRRPHVDAQNMGGKQSFLDGW